MSVVKTNHVWCLYDLQPPSMVAVVNWIIFNESQSNSVEALRILEVCFEKKYKTLHRSSSARFF